MRREKVQVEGLRPWLRNGHDTGDRKRAVWLVFPVYTRENWEKCRKVGCNHTYP